MSKKGGLGKGFEALFYDNSVASEDIKTLSVNELSPNKNQPRKEFNADKLNELADSIREHGLIQPILVRPLPSGGYEIVAGERRFRASRLAGLSEVPVIIKDIPEDDLMEFALIENLQREDLNPIEEAKGIDVLLKAGYTQEEVAKKLSKSRSAIANTHRLLDLSEYVLKKVESGEISEGHARVTITLDEKKAKLVCDEIIKNSLSVRETEKLVRDMLMNKKPTAVKFTENKFYSEMQAALTKDFAKIKIKAKHGGGVIEIPFKTEEELKEIAQILAKGKK